MAKVLAKKPERTSTIEASKPAVSQRVKVRGGMSAMELSKAVVGVAEEQDYRGFRTFLPGELYGEKGSKFVLKVALDPDDPSRDLILRPKNSDTFRTGHQVGGQLILESALSAPVEGEAGIVQLGLVDELQTASAALIIALQERLNTP